LDRRQLRKTLHKQTNKQTDRQTNRHYRNNGHLAVNQYLKILTTDSSEKDELGKGL